MKEAIGSFDDLACSDEQRVGHLDAERFGSLEVDHEIELRRLLDRQFGGLGALENSAGVFAKLPIGIGNIRTVAHQSAGLNIFTPRIDHRQFVDCCELNDQGAFAREESIGADYEC